MKKPRPDKALHEMESLHLNNGQEVYGWSALDAHTREVILVWTTQGRGGLEAPLFLKNVLRRCSNPHPFFRLDAGCW